MQTCKTCRYYFKPTSSCNFGVGDNNYTIFETSQYDGQQWCWPRYNMRIDKRRAEDGICGPEAKLYKPRLRTRLWVYITEKLRRSRSEN